MYELTDEIVKKSTRLITKTPAHYKMKNTGKTHIVDVVGPDGEMIGVEQPLKERVFIDVVREEITEDKIYHGVRNIYTGEVHEFAAPEEATRFITESS